MKYNRRYLSSSIKKIISWHLFYYIDLHALLCNELKSPRNLRIPSLFTSPCVLIDFRLEFFNSVKSTWEMLQRKLTIFIKETEQHMWK